MCRTGYFFVQYIFLWVSFRSVAAVELSETSTCVVAAPAVEPTYQVVGSSKRAVHKPVPLKADWPMLVTLAGMFTVRKKDLYAKA